MSINIPAPSPPDSVIISFFTLRKIVGLLGILLVPVLIVGSFIFDHTRQIKISVSAYYFSSMRNELVGIICGIALFLISYHGYSWKDSLASKLSGIFALCVAFFPTSATNDKTDIISKVHYLTSGAFFVSLSYMSIFLFTKSTAIHKTRQKNQRNRVYVVCGIIMLLSVSCIALKTIPAINEFIPFFDTIVFETIALTSFGISWLIKGEVLLKDKPGANPLPDPSG